MKIEIIQDDHNHYLTLLEYESEIVPLPGDTYAGINFKDGYQRTIKSRMLMPSCPKNIIVYVEYSFPILVKDLPTEEQTDSALVETKLQNYLS